MKLINYLGANEAVLQFRNGDELLFSYNTPVAGFINGSWVMTAHKWSRTTSKHITQYFRGRYPINVTVMPQEWFDRVREEVFST